MLERDVGYVDKKICCMRRAFFVDMDLQGRGGFIYVFPKKGHGSAGYIRSFLYPAMQEYFQGKELVRGGFHAETLPCILEKWNKKRKRYS